SATAVQARTTFSARPTASPLSRGWRSTDRRAIRRAAAARTEPLFPARLTIGGAVAPRRAPDRTLPDSFRMFSAPAVLPHRRRLVEDGADFLYEILGEAGLGHERVAAGFPRTFRDARQRMAGERHNRNRSGPLVGLEPARRFPPVHDRQRQVHQDDIR